MRVILPMRLLRIPRPFDPPAIMWSWSFPAGVVLSSDSPSETNATPTAAISSSTVTR